MKIFWVVSILIYIITVIKTYIKNRKLLTVSNVVLISTQGCFFLFLLGWSRDFVTPCSSETYYVMGCQAILMILFALTEKADATNTANSDYNFVRFSIGEIKILLSVILLCLCIGLAMIENIYISGLLIAPNSVQFHTKSMPVIGTIARGLYPVAYCVAIKDFMRFKSKIPLLLLCSCVLYTLLGAGSRYWTSISLMTTLFFLYEQYVTVHKKIRLRVLVPEIIGGILLFNIFMNLGIARTGAQTYAQWIQYTGPGKGTIFELVMSWFYGYFPYSFYNLNNTIANIRENSLYTYGQFTLYPYLSFFHLDGLFGVVLNDITFSRRVFYNTAATVATGWYEYYADFGRLFFIRIAIQLWLTRYFQKKGRFFGTLSYAAMVTTWVFMSFNNNYTVGIIQYTFFFSWVLERFFTVKKETVRKNEV